MMQISLVVETFMACSCFVLLIFSHLIVISRSLCSGPIILSYESCRMAQLLLPYVNSALQNVMPT